MTQRPTFGGPAIHTPQPIVRAAAAPDTVLSSLSAPWQCDLADDSLTWGAGVFALFGLDRDTPLDRRAIVEMYAAPSRALLERLRTRAIATAGSFTFEAEIIRPSGEHRWMRVTADTVTAAGRTTHLYGTKQDITDEMEPAAPAC